MVTRTRVVTLTSVIALVAAAVIGYGLLTKESSTHVKAVFSQTVGLYKGSEVRVLGVTVGSVQSVTPKGDGVVVDFTIDGDQKVAADTGAVVIAPSLVSDRYVQLTEPWVSGPTLQDGAEIPQARTAVPVELDQIYASLDQLATALGPNGANRTGALSELLKTGAANLDGNGADINKVIREFGDATGTLAASDDDLFATVDNLDRFNQMLAANDGAVSQVNSQFATVTQYLAEDRDDLATAIRTLGDSLGQVKGFLRANRSHLRSSVENLTSTTKLLDEQRASLNQLLKTLPVALQNFLGAYNPATGTIDGRANLNELSIWATSVGKQSGKQSGQQSGQQAPPPLLLPGVGARP